MSPGVGVSVAAGGTTAGPVLFARYAFKPNQLGYCGGTAPELLLEAASGTVPPPERHLRAVCEEFEGAMPYLRLIAASGGIADPLDPRVVEAYWIGSPLLDAVVPARFGRDIEDRWRGRAREYGWLLGKPLEGAIPHHSFHVFEVYPRAGLMRSGDVSNLLETMTSCLVRPATVVERDGARLSVEAGRVEVHEGKLALTEAATETVLAFCEGATFVDPSPGDSVAVHWGWACEVLTPRRRAALERATARSLELANTTF